MQKPWCVCRSRSTKMEGVKLSKNQRKRLKAKAAKSAVGGGVNERLEAYRNARAQQEDEGKASAMVDHNEVSNQVVIEYVSQGLDSMIAEDDPAYEEMQQVFGKFLSAEDLCAEKSKEDEMNKVVDAAGEQEEKNDEPEKEGEEGQLSRKLRKKMKRLGVAELKQLVSRPDVVEAHDVTSADPKLLVYLKAYRNTVPVPLHWCHKRKYLQGKRGVEKAPFALPDFIAQTGISEIRSAAAEEDEKKKSKQKARERVQPKMGRVDIDYQTLHDAFFRYQTKPTLTILGDLYYEGKEFEVNLKTREPGKLSDELKQALGMAEGVPPPWLLHMQRYGPPPAYPNLKIPGLNAPIPEGCSFGYHPGGWGKPPVDEHGRHLYGDVFAQPAALEGMDGEPVDRTRWGEIEKMDEEEEEEEEEDDEEDQDMVEHLSTQPDASGMETPHADGIASVASGLETPGVVDLRKGIRTETPDAPQLQQQSLYTVLEEKKTTVGQGFYGSTHGYKVPSGEKDGTNASELEADLESTEQGEDTEEERKRKRKLAKSSEGKNKKYKDFKF